MEHKKMSIERPIKNKNYGLNKIKANKDLNAEMFSIHAENKTIKAKRLIFNYAFDYGVFDDGVQYGLFDLESKKEIPYNKSHVENILKNNDKVLENTLF